MTKNMKFMANIIMGNFDIVKLFQLYYQKSCLGR